MLKYIGKRLLLFIPTIFIISVVIFFIIQLPPGDYATSYAAAMAAEGEIMTPEQIQELRMQFGLDKPWYIQYFNWMADIITKGDFGYSFEYGRAVWDVIAQYLPLTLGISFVILVFQYAVSLPIGIYCANHQYSVGDYISSIIGFLGAAIPNFILAIVLMYLSYKWTGNANVGLFSQEMLQNGIHLYNFGEFLKRMIIPILVIGTSGTCGIIRSVRAQMLDAVAMQYPLTARAKGVPERTIIMKYCFRAAINPTVSGLGGVLSSLFSGSTVTAMVLNMQIQGPVLLKALQAQDMYLAGAIVMVQAVLVVVGILLSDIALAFLDPRIRYSGGGR